MSDMRIVWFKRDLRVHDHGALAAACLGGGPVLPLYIFEPGLWALPEHSGRQFAFLQECLGELDQALKARGSGLVVKVGEATDVFGALHKTHGVEAIHAHEETGLGWTYDRDKAVAAWARRAGIPFLETSQHGVIRGLKDRGGWAKRWDAMMDQPRIKAPKTLPPLPEESAAWPPPAEMGLTPAPCPGRQ